MPLTNREYTFICALCGTAEVVRDIDIYERLKQHRREHYGVLKGSGNAVVVFYDPNDELDSWFNLLLTWKLSQDAGEQDTEGH